jgi:hypothetical protein
MKPRILAIFLVIVGAAARAQSAMERQLFDLVNHERAKAGLNKLEWNDKLAQAALAHSRLLGQHQDLSHQFAGEHNLQERAGATGVRFNSVAENVAEAPDVETAHRGLMNSPGHRENILNRDYNAIGISIVQDGRQLFVTQDFAHVLPSYTEKQFQNALVIDINKARRAEKLPALDIVSDARLRKAACAKDMNTDRMIQNLPGATQLLVFSQSEPGALSNDMRHAVSNPSLHRLNIGVCLESGGRNGFSHFWVVAAFYPQNDDNDR